MRETPPVSARASTSTAQGELPSKIHIDRSPGLRGSVDVPGSKSHTNRALVIAGLAKGTSRISNALVGDDAESMVSGLRALGADIVEEAPLGAPGTWSVAGTGGVLSARPIVIDANLAGTTLRFLTAVAVLGSGAIELTGGAPLCNRPIGPLLDGLRRCGATLRGSGKLGDRAPIVVDRRKGPLGGRVKLDSSQSSQFVTALLLVAPYFDGDLILEHHGAGARGFIDMTVELMARHGAAVEVAENAFRVSAGMTYEAADERVPPDASAASHLFTLAIATEGELTINHLTSARSQPDFSVLSVFEEFGARVSLGPDGSVTVAAPAHLRPVDIDLRKMPDQLPNVAVLAALARGTSRIRGVHETNRMVAIVQELARAGVHAEVGHDDVIVQGGGASGAVTFCSYHDHRMAMAVAALAAAVGNSHVAGAESVSKRLLVRRSEARSQAASDLTPRAPLGLRLSPRPARASEPCAYARGPAPAAGSMTEVAPTPVGGSTFCSRSATGW